VATGQWVATETPDDGRGMLVVAPESLVRAAHEQCASLSYTGPDNCSKAADIGDGLVLVGSGAGSYNPLYYWFVGSVAKPFSGATALYVMRCASALLCLLFVGLAAWAVAIRRTSRWSRVGFVVAITPVMLYSTAIAAPNGLEMAAALAFWCALLSLDGTLEARRERMLLFVAAAAGAVLMVDRLLGPLFALLALVTVWAMRPSLVVHVFVRYRRLFITGSAVVVAAAAWAVAWYFIHRVHPPAPEKQGGDWSWSVLILWPLQAIAAFPFRDQPGALIVYPVVLMIFGGLVWQALRLGVGRERAVLAMTIALSLGLPLVLTAITYEGRGAMWQGRYGLPYSMGIVLLASHVLDVRGWVSRFRPGLLVIGSALLAISTAACFVKVLNRELARSVSSVDGAWHQPSVALLVAGTTVAWLLLHRACARDDDVVGR
jgi:hypothetical protein